MGIWTTIADILEFWWNGIKEKQRHHVKLFSKSTMWCCYPRIKHFLQD